MRYAIIIFFAGKIFVSRKRYDSREEAKTVAESLIAADIFGSRIYVKLMPAA